MGARGLKIFDRKEGIKAKWGAVSRNGGFPYYTEVVFEISHDAAWKKPWCVYLFFVNKYVLQNKCPSKKKNEMIAINIIDIVIFNCYLDVPRPALNHYWGGSLIHPKLITAFLHIWPEGHCEPCKEVGSLNTAEDLVEVEPGTHWFCLQCPDPSGHFSWTQCYNSCTDY